MNNLSSKPIFQKPVFLSKIQLQYPTVNTFLIRLIILYLSWEICFHIIWQYPSLTIAYRNFSLFIIDNILNHTAWLLDILYYTTEIDLGERLVKIIGTVGVTVGEPCIGLGVMAVFFALIAAYPGHHSKKTWFIPLGLLAIYTANIIRISLLAVIVKTDPAIWELNHKFIFKFIIYSLVFLLWKQWIQYVQPKKS
jgi:exosortase/archaeosortase family protein